ncbi:MAG: HAD-IA family hydrolase [bacterium]|nr:HAD-IA family hydrolase [bacterium]
MQLEALIFDCDGTLAETEEAHRAAFNTLFREHNLDWHWSIETYTQLLEITGGKERIRHFLRHYAPSKADYYIENDHLILPMHVRKTAIYMDLVKTGEVPLRPGVERLIREARAAGMHLAIATTTNIDPLSALFEGTLGRDALAWFDAIAAGDMVANKKPAGDVYELALKGLNLQGPQCLAFEDTTNGILAARTANIPVLITVSEYSAGQDFSGALAVIDSLGEPDTPFKALSGFADKAAHVDLDLAKKWHAAGLNG